MEKEPKMEKEPNKLILKFSKIFTNSCRTQNLSQVIDHSKQPIFTPQPQPQRQPQPQATSMEDQEEEEQHPFSSLLRGHPPLICKPRCPESIDLMVRENCIIAGTSRRKITGKYNLLSPAAGRCPPVSPATPLFLTAMKNNTKMNPIHNQKHKHIPHLPANHPFNFSSSNETDFFSSDDEREEDYYFKNSKNSMDKTEHPLFKTEHALFSSLKSVSFSSKSISLSSDSEPLDPPRPRPRRRRRRTRRRRAAEEEDPEVVPMQGKVKDTFAVVKSSKDPYSDFRTSMVEMIMENQIFGSKELEQLLKCFLQLNSQHHHRVIVEVFTEICDALFSHLG